MQIRKITVGRTFNIGNYESLRLDIEADLESFDTPEKAAVVLNAKLNTMRGRIEDAINEWTDEPAASPTS